MADAFLGEIRIFAGSFAPKYWALCNGQLMPIQQNTALFSILGVQYGGDGRSTFALPNLMGRAPLGQGNGTGLTARTLGGTGGEATVTLLMSQMPAHNHLPAVGKTPGAKEEAVHNVWAKTPGFSGREAYANPSGGGLGPMSMTAIGAAGGSMPHNNMQQYLAMNYIICISGIFPSRG